MGSFQWQDKFSEKVVKNEEVVKIKVDNNLIRKIKEIKPDKFSKESRKKILEHDNWSHRWYVR